MDEAFFTCTAMEVTAVISVDRRKIGDRKHGDITGKIKEFYSSITKGRNPNYKNYCTKVY